MNIQKIVIDEKAKGLPYTEALLRRAPSGAKLEEWREGDQKPTGKTTLFVTVEPGGWIKQCPCTPGVLRCGYHVFTLGFQCPYECSYCFLRFYAPDEPLTLYANLDDAERAFRDYAKGFAKPVRMGTGEFTDSLALEPLSGHLEFLTPLLRDHPNVFMELKTKSANAGAVLSQNLPPNMLVAWTLNSRRAVEVHEPLTASLDARLDAAKSVADAGRLVAFHFDPIIREGDWRKDYGEVVDMIFDLIDPKKVAWISLGGLRFPKRFLEGAQLGGHPAYYDEFVLSPDGKLRYFWPLRAELFSFMGERITQRSGGQTPHYLCMEGENLWRKTLGHSPGEEGVEGFLTQNCCLR